MIVVFSPCTANKDDTNPIEEGSKVIEPPFFLNDAGIVRRLIETRNKVLNIPGVLRGNRITYAFDLYVRKGNAYRGLYEKHYGRLKNKLLNDDSVHWFFLSGGYGVIHALERAQNYQASFVRLPKEKNVTFTKPIWEEADLGGMCEAILRTLKPHCIYAFGSANYIAFIKQTCFSFSSANGARVKIFRSRCSAGPYWLEPRITELAEAIIEDSLEDFDRRYPGMEMDQELCGAFVKVEE